MRWDGGWPPKRPPQLWSPNSTWTRSEGMTATTRKHCHLPVSKGASLKQSPQMAFQIQSTDLYTNSSPACNLSVSLGSETCGSIHSVYIYAAYLARSDLQGGATVADGLRTDRAITVQKACHRECRSLSSVSIRDTQGQEAGCKADLVSRLPS